MHSMTGYGRGEAARAGARVAAEIHSVNKRQVEVQISLPATLAALEEELRAAVTRRVHRGRLSVGVTAQLNGDAPQPTVNEPLARGYLEAFRRLQTTLGIGGEVSLDTLLRLPGVLGAPAEPGIRAETREALAEATERALDALLVMRANEGAHLQRDLLGRTSTLRSLLAEVALKRPGTLARHLANLRERIARLGVEVGVDDERLAREVAFFADRSDFSEEVTRLQSHLEQFEATCHRSESIGRTLEFIAQEIGRELNTLSAKANDAEVSQLVVAAKAELEKVREQVQNVE